MIHAKLVPRSSHFCTQEMIRAIFKNRTTKLDYRNGNWYKMEETKKLPVVTHYNQYLHAVIQ